MKKKSKTDLRMVKAMKASEAGFSDSSLPNGKYFTEAVFWHGTKRQITLRLDPDVVDYFKKQGRGYQSMINAVLRKYVEAGVQ